MSDAKKTKKGEGVRAEIPVACIKRIASDVAGDFRISTEAVEQLTAYTVEYLKTVVERAASYTNARKRKTISGEDVENGLETLD